MASLCATATFLVPTNPARADSIRNEQWHLRYLNIAEVHRQSQGAGVTVAVVDSGVYPHRDLNANLLPGTDVVPGGTGDGRADNDGHGTGMAGLIAAHGRPGESGALGVAPKARILPVRDSTSKGNDPGTSDDVALGIQWAVQHGATVINLSTAGEPSQSLEAAVKTAQYADVVLIAGAGNKPEFFGVAYPALYDGVIAVGATDQNGNRAEISVTGPAITLSAPGVRIFTTANGGEYRRAQGTSDSAALVSGAAALVRSKFPHLSAPEVIHRLTATATDKGPPGRDDEYGFGVLNIVAALTADVPPLASATPSATPAEPPTSPGATTAEAVPPPGSGGASGSTTTLALVGATIIGCALAGIGVVLERRRRRARGPS